MSYVMNYGTIDLNKPITKEAIEAFRNSLKHPESYEDLISAMEEGNESIELDEYYDKYALETLTYLIDALKPLGYVLNTTIRYYGDWEGFVVIQDNEIAERDILDAWELLATDEDLIKVLVERGYKVSK